MKLWLLISVGLLSKRTADANSFAIIAPTMATTIKFDGLSETLTYLKNYEKELYDALRKELVTTGDPLAKKVGEYFPDNPFNPFGGVRNNWHTGRARLASGFPPYDGSRAATRVKAVAGRGGSSKRAASNILRIQQMDAGGSIYDSAGGKGGKGWRGANFIKALDSHTQTKSRSGKPRSRSMFVAVKNNQPMIEQEMLKVVKKIDDATTRRINATGNI